MPIDPTILVRVVTAATRVFPRRIELFSNTNQCIDRGYSVRESLPLPTKPPYTVHLGNMSFDATEGDIQDFFASCQVTNVRIVEDKLDRKPKGFGYAEFATLDGLKKALDYNGQQFQGRNIRVSVAEPRMYFYMVYRYRTPSLT